MIRALALIATLALTACGTPQTARQATGALSLPPMNTFARATPGRPTQSNAILARDFIDLTFTLENGHNLPVFTRFEGPVAVRVLGRAPASLSRDLDSLIERLRREAQAIAQVCEMTWQIRGQAEGRQVQGAKAAIAVNQGLFGHGSAVICTA